MTKQIQYFYVVFDMPKDAGKTLKHQTDHFMKDNELVYEQRIKHGIDQLLYTYNHGNDI